MAVKRKQAEHENRSRAAKEHERQKHLLKTIHVAHSNDLTAGQLGAKQSMMAFSLEFVLKLKIGFIRDAVNVSRKLLDDPGVIRRFRSDPATPGVSEAEREKKLRDIKTRLKVAHDYLETIQEWTADPEYVRSHLAELIEVTDELVPVAETMLADAHAMASVK